MCNNCNKCRKPRQTPCGCPEPIEKECGCVGGTREFKCTIYTGEPLVNIDVNKGYDGDRVLEQIDKAVDQLWDTLDGVTDQIDSIGNGTPIYNGLSEDAIHEIKSLSVSEGIELSDEQGTITLSVKKAWLKKEFDKFIRESSTTDYLKEQFNNFLKQSGVLESIKDIRANCCNGQAPSYDTPDKCLTVAAGQQTVEGSIVKGRDASAAMFPSVTFDVSPACKGGFNVLETEIINEDGFTLYYPATVVPPNSSTIVIPVKARGAYNGNLDVIERQHKFKPDSNVYANFRVNVDTVEKCIKLSDAGDNALNVTHRITKGIPVINETLATVKYTNSCMSDITVPELVFIDEDGIKVSIPSTMVPSNSSMYVTLNINGTYTGNKTQLVGQKVTGTLTNIVTVDVTIPAANQKPVTKPVTITLANRQNTEVKEVNLDWLDADRDALQAVRFTGDVSRLFTDTQRTVPYVAGTELPPTFTLYYKAPDQDAESTYTLNYDVKAGNEWSE